jgi:hypothetical protein
MNGAKIAFKTPMNMKRLLSLKNRINQGSNSHVNDAPVNQCRSVLAFQEYLPHPSASIKQVFHQTKLEVPLKGTRKCPAFALLCGQPAMERDTQVKELFVKKSNQEVFLPHDSIRDVVGVQFSTLAGTWVRRRRGEFCEWIGIANSSDPSNDFGPRNGLDIFLENVWEMASGIRVRSVRQVFEGGRYKSGTCPRAALCSRRRERFATRRRRRTREKIGG